MIDELKRKKFLEQLAGRTPSSDEVQMDTTDVYGKDKEEPVIYNNEEPNSLTPTPDREGTSRTNALTDMVVGAAPTLLGFLSGNYNRIAMGTDTSNKYLKQKAEEDRITSKDLVKVMRNGKPIYLPAKEAVDQEVPATKVGGSAAKPQLKEFELISNPNETVLTFVDPNTGTIKDSRTGDNLDLSSYQPKQTYYNKAVKNQYGEQTVETIGRAGKRLGGSQLAEGEGSKVNIPVTKLRDAEKVSKDYTARASKYQDDILLLDSAYKTLTDPNSSPQEKKVAIGNVIKSVEPRMTDSDRSEYKGEASALVGFGDKIDMLTSNEVPPQTINAFIQAAKNMKNKVVSASSSFRDASVTRFAGNDEKLKSYIGERLSPISSSVSYTIAAPRKSFKQGKDAQPSVKSIIEGGDERRKRLLEEKARRSAGKK